MRALLINVDDGASISTYVKIRLIDKSGDPDVATWSTYEGTQFPAFWVKPEMLPLLNIVLVGHEVEESI